MASVSNDTVRIRRRRRRERGMSRSMKMTMIRVTILALSLFSFSETITVHVSASGPSPSPQPQPRGPQNFTVGGILGWVVPPGGHRFYKSWARSKTFMVGDALEFLFINGTQDVAVVKQEDYDNCQTNNTIAVYPSSPVRIVLNATGEHFYTSTYRNHCALGQKLAINVTSNSNGWSSPPPSPSPDGA